MRRMLWCGLALLLSGCQAGLQRSDTGSVGMPKQPPSVTRRLIDFSSRFQALARPDQLALCDSMRLSLKRDAGSPLGWYLATAITRVDGCGEPDEAVRLIQRLLDRSRLDHEAEWLARYQLDWLQQQAELQAAAQQERQGLHKKLLQAEDKARQLEEKLRDLKRIETSINKRLDEQQEAK